MSERVDRGAATVAGRLRAQRSWRRRTVVVLVLVLVVAVVVVAAVATAVVEAPLRRSRTMMCWMLIAATTMLSVTIDHDALATLNVTIAPQAARLSTRKRI